MYLKGWVFMIGSGNGEEIDNLFACCEWGKGGMKTIIMRGVWGGKSDEKGTVVGFKAFCLVLVFGMKIAFK